MRVWEKDSGHLLPTNTLFSALGSCLIVEHRLDASSVLLSPQFSHDAGPLLLSTQFTSHPRHAYTTAWV